jgi:hypothetical protein
LRPQEIFPRWPRRRDFFSQLLFGAFADRGEVERGLDVLFERRELFAADDAAGDSLAEVELEKSAGEALRVPVTTKICVTSNSPRSSSAS